MAGHAYENAYKLIHDVRVGVNEYSSGLWAGTDTSGKYSNTYLLEKINTAQSRIYALMMKTEARGVFYEEASITGVSSVFTLPWDYGRLLQFEDSRGYKVFPVSAKNTPLTGQQGSKNLYYRDGQTLVLTHSGVSDTYKLKYYKMPRKLTWGVAAASSGALDLRLAATDVTVLRNDYYNGFRIDNYTQGLSTTVTDFVASTRSATTAAITWVASTDYYGTVSDLPEAVHHLLAPLAVILVKAQHPASQERPTREEMLLWGEMLMESMVGFITEPEDIPIEDIFCDFGDNLGMGGYLVPGHNSPVM
jgi:hypothetical protein